MDFKVQEEENEDGDDNDEMLSSIHTIKDSDNTPRDKYKFGHGSSSIKQYQFLKNEREEENCF